MSAFFSTSSIELANFSKFLCNFTTNIQNYRYSRSKLQWKNFSASEISQRKSEKLSFDIKKNFTCFTICICWLSYFCGCIQKSRPWKFGIRKLIFIKRVDLNGFSYFFSLKIPIKILKLLQNLIRYSRTTPISFLFYWYSIKKKNMKRKE